MFAKVLDYKYVDMDLCSVSRDGGRVVVRAVLLRTNQATPATGPCNQWLDTADTVALPTASYQIHQLVYGKQLNYKLHSLHSTVLSTDVFVYASRETLNWELFMESEN